MDVSILDPGAPICSLFLLEIGWNTKILERVFHLQIVAFIDQIPRVVVSLGDTLP